MIVFDDYYVKIRKSECDISKLILDLTTLCTHLRANDYKIYLKIDLTLKEEIVIYTYLENNGDSTLNLVNLSDASSVLLNKKELSVEGFLQDLDEMLNIYLSQE